MINPQLPNESPSRVSTRTLRQFAALCLGIFGLLFGLSLYRHSGTPTAAGWVALGLALLLGLPGLIQPSLVRPVFLSAMAVTRPIGHLTSLILLGVVYYVFLTPLALFFRLAGRDVLKRKRRNVASYWTPKPQPADPRRYLRQYQRQQAETLEKENRIYGKSEFNSR